MKNGVGGQDGNDNAKKRTAENQQFVKPTDKTRSEIAKSLGVSKHYVIQSVEF